MSAVCKTWQQIDCTWKRTTDLISAEKEQPFYSTSELIMEGFAENISFSCYLQILTLIFQAGG